jgi:phage tail sheath protein FI
MPFKHGITLTEISTGARTLTAVSTAILGLVATAPDADADTFPLDRPVLVTDIETAIGRPGLPARSPARCARLPTRPARSWSWCAWPKGPTMRPPPAT